jgi:serine/threonine-protein kinase HipA
VAGTKTSVDDHMTLLLAVGADTISDVRVLPSREEPPLAMVAFDPERVRTLDVAEVFAAVSGPDALELDPAALPGVQAKVSAVMYSTPLTTKSGPAILKIAPAQGYPRLVENEHFFMSLAADCGLIVPRHQIVHDMHDRPGLLVSRFDRNSGSSIAQEDACQVMAMYPAEKYRMKTEEIVGALSSVCERGGGSARVATLDVLRLVAYSYAIGNGDLHGENFSVLAPTPEMWRVTPAYDLLRTQPYLSWRDPMALDFDGRANRLSRRHFVESAGRLGIPERALTRMLDQVCSGIVAGAEKVEDIGFADDDTSRLRELLLHRVDELRSYASIHRGFEHQPSETDMTKWALLGCAIVSEVTASLSLKAALDQPGWYVVVATGYIASFVLLSFVLKAGLPLGVAYGIWGALGVALTAIMSAIIFGEPLTVVMGFGLLLIIGGVLCVEIGSQKAQQEVGR